MSKPAWSTNDLILAAPHMYQALREIVAINDEGPGEFRKRGGTRRGLSISVAKSALAKADGLSRPTAPERPRKPRAEA